MKYWNEIDTLEYGFLTKITESAENTLVFEIEYGRPAEYEEMVKIGNQDFGMARRIIRDAKSPKYQIRFDEYIGYSVINESYADKGSEDFIGNYLRVYQNSNYLDFIGKESFASKDYPGEFKHYEFLTENHIVDVISHYEPTIEKLS
jgi:hypothetical protein